MKPLTNPVHSGIKSDVIIFFIKLTLGFVTIPAYLYFVTMEEFGFYVAVQSMVVLLSLADIGLGQYAVKMLSHPKYRETHGAVFLTSVQTFQYILGGGLFTLGAVVFFFFEQLANNEFPKGVEWLFFLSWCSVVLKTSFGLIPSLLQAHSKLAYLNFMNFLTFIVSIMLNIILLANGTGLISFGISLIIANLITMSFMYFKLNTLSSCNFLLPTKVQKSYIIAGWNYVKKFQLLRMSHIAKSSLFVVMLGSLGNATMVAMYNITNKVPQLFPELISKLVLNFFPSYASLYETGDLSKLKQEYKKILNIGIQTSFFVVFSLYYLNHTFVGIWVGGDKFIGDEIFVLMLIATCMQLIGSYTGLIIQISGEFKKTPYLAVLEILLFLLFSQLFVRFMGSFGIFLAVIFSSLPSFIYSQFVVKTILTLSYHDVLKDNYKNVLILITAQSFVSVMINVNFDNDTVRLILMASIFCAIFAATQWHLIPDRYKKKIKRI